MAKQRQDDAQNSNVDGEDVDALPHYFGYIDEVDDIDELPEPFIRSNHRHIFECEHEHSYVEGDGDYIKIFDRTDIQASGEQPNVICYRVSVACWKNVAIRCYCRGEARAEELKEYLKNRFTVIFTEMFGYIDGFNADNFGIDSVPHLHFTIEGITGLNPILTTLPLPYLQAVGWKPLRNVWKKWQWKPSVMNINSIIDVINIVVI